MYIACDINSLIEPATKTRAGRENEQGRKKLVNLYAQNQFLSTIGNNERASYNGSIEASQASDVGSIPIARSRNTEDKQVTLRLTPIQHLTPIQRLGFRFFRPDRELHGAANLQPRARTSEAWSSHHHDAIAAAQQ